MPIHFKHPFVIGGALLVLAALIFVGGVMYLKAGSEIPGAPMLANGHALAPGAKNPADSLQKYDGGLGIIDGTVTAVGSDSITISSGPASTNFTILIDANTEIYTVGKTKDPTSYAKELAKFRDTLTYAADDVEHIYIAPEDYEHAAVSLSSLSSGDYVAVTPEKSTAPYTLTALKVFVQPK